MTVFVYSLVDYPFFAYLGLGAWIFVLIGALWSYAHDRYSPEDSSAAPRYTVWLTRLTAAPAIPVLAFGAFLTVRLAWADSLYRRATPASVERAAMLFPGNAEYHFALAQLEPQRAASELVRCLAINPFRTDARIQLAAYVEDRGDLTQASAILLEAARRDTQFAPAWTLVKFYFRNRQPELFWHWARIAADMDYGDLQPLFDLCFLVTNDSQIVRDRAVPPKRSVEVQFLSYLTSHQRLSGAESVAREMAENPRPADREPLLNYIDESLTVARFAAARQIWNAMSGSGIGLVKADSSRPIPSREFDWHLAAVAGVVVTQPRQNQPELKVALSGRQPGNCEILSQILSLQPGEKYALQFEYKTSDLPGQTGLRWSFGSNREFALASSPLWVSAEWRFSASADAGRLSLAYTRIPGTTRTEGTLTLRRTRITKVP